MLAEWVEFDHLLRQPGDPDAPIAVSRNGRTFTSALVRQGDGTSIHYPIVQNQPVLIAFSRSLAREAIVAMGRSPVKRNPNWIRIAKGWTVGTAKSSARNLRKFRNCLAQAGGGHPLVLMVGAATRGAGTRDLYEDASVRQIAFDIYPSPQVHFVADAHDIPLASNSVDGVCIQAVLEHVLDPSRVVSEIARVLKPNGIVYAETPFMQQVHEGAYDFTRFTELGHRWLFRDFEAIDRGSLGGAGLSLYWAARYFMRGLTRSRTLGDLLSLPFMLAAAMDRLIPEAHRIDSANGVYFLGWRNGNGVSLDTLVGEYRGAQR